MAEPFYKHGFIRPEESFCFRFFGSLRQHFIPERLRSLDDPKSVPIHRFLYYTI